ncbi:MAG: hypothetical protein ABEL76_01985, partial [Bradymonadaceae bacterium]
MAAGRPHPNPETVPCLLRAWHHDEIEAFLSARVPENLFQLCWIENRGVQPLRDPDLFHFRGLRGEDGRLRGVCLVIADQLALLDTRGEEAARRLGRWYRENGLDFEHVVSARRCVEPFWKGYARAGRHRLEAELNRIQTMYIFRSRDWLDRPAVDGESPDPTPLRYARRGDLDALLEASVA